MAEEIKISPQEFVQQIEEWKQKEELINPEINTLEPFGELEVLNRYINNYGKMSLLIGDYLKLLQEDRNRIFGAIATFLEAEAKLLK